MTVAPGMEISTVLNNSPFLFFSGSEPGQSIHFRGVRNGVDAWGPYGPFGSQGAIAGAIRLEPGVWNLTFQSGGRIALGVELSELCPNSNSSISRGGSFACPPIDVTERIAFSLVSLDSTFPTAYHVEGLVDSAFYDRYLRPLANGPDGRFGATPGILVVSPHGGATSVLISARVVEDRGLLVPIFVYAILVAVAILTVTGLIVGARFLRRRPGR